MDMGNLKYWYARLSAAEKLILVNVVVFVLDGLFKGLGGFSLEPWFALPKDFGSFLLQPWSLVTYSFFHGSLGHIFWNMLMLYFAARIFLNLFGPKRFLTVYFLGVIMGGLIFLMGYNVFPTLINTNAILIGASAGVMAVMIFICTYIPDQEVRVIFFNVKLWMVGVFFVLSDLLQIPFNHNVGGHLAHLGGAFLGYFYARQLFQGRDIGAGFQRFFERLFSREKRSPMKTVHRKSGKAKSSTSKTAPSKTAHQRKIDDILDKIGKSGYESLTKEEKEFLFRSGKED